MLFGTVNVQKQACWASSGTLMQDCVWSTTMQQSGSKVHVQPALLKVKEMCLLSSDHCTKLYQQLSGTPCTLVSRLAGAGMTKSSVIGTTAIPEVI